MALLERENLRVSFPTANGPVDVVKGLSLSLGRDSALDVSVQAKILNLLKRLRAEQNLTYLMVSHNLPVVGFLCERMAVMQQGRVMEFCQTAALRTGESSSEYAQGLYVASGGLGLAGVA